MNLQSVFEPQTTTRMPTANSSMLALKSILYYSLVSYVSYKKKLILCLSTKRIGDDIEYDPKIIIFCKTWNGFILQFRNYVLFKMHTILWMFFRNSKLFSTTVNTNVGNKMLKWSFLYVVKYTDIINKIKIYICCSTAKGYQTDIVKVFIFYFLLSLPNKW